MTTHFVVNFLLIKDQKVLLERKVGGSWKIPGGHIDPGEMPTETLFREAREELGVTVNIKSQPQLFNFGVTAYTIPVPFEMFCHQVEKDGSLGDEHRNIGLVYRVDTNEEPTAQEGQEIRWFTEDELEKEDIQAPIRLIAQKGLHNY